MKRGVLVWKRDRDESGVFYRGVPRSGEVYVVTNYGRGEWRAEAEMVPKVGLAGGYWAESKKEAQLACEVMALGGDPKEHATRCSHSRRGTAIRGGWTTIWKWSCSCGEKSSGGHDAESAKHYSREHRIAKLREFVEAHS